MALEKISHSIWQLPKTGSMKVPARFYASPTLIEKMQQDRTLTQASNVANLPGIQKYSFVMPDGHEGYGFPIGGVAAFDPQEGGVVSPGGVGYDINCLCQGTPILCELGYFKPIESFELEFEQQSMQNPSLTGSYQLYLKTASKIASLNIKTGQMARQNVLAFMKKKADNQILLIKTRLGQSLQCSQDHPLLTAGGEMKKAGILHPGESVATNFFQGVPYQKIPLQQMPREVQDERALGILAKILGYMLGDGTFYESGKKKRACAFGKKEDLELMRQDLESIGFKASVFERKRAHEIETQYGRKKFESTCAELHVYSQKFCGLIESLGLPKGKKASQNFEVPAWVRESPLWVKRLFLAGLFGAELSSPSTSCKTGFYIPILSQNKNEANAASGRLFFIQLMQLLEELGVKTCKIAQRDEHKNKQGKTVRLRLEISAEEENLLLLYQKIGFEYSQKKSRLAQIACKYALAKKALTQKRTQIAKKTKELKQKGLTLAETQRILACEDANPRFIERHFYETAGQRITLDFPSFKEFTEKQLQQLNALGALCDEIESITETAYDGLVYDFTVQETHNFIANGFIVSNCGVRLLKTNLTEKEVRPKLKEIVEGMYKNIPSGVGSKSRIRLNPKELEEAVTLGPQWAVERGMGVKEDVENCEEKGAMQGVDYSQVSDMAKKRGGPQFGTLGAGNHFLEIQKVEQIYDQEAAKAFGITSEGQITVMIHCGSRGYGHQICDDYLRTMIQAAQKYNINLPDRELCCAPLGTPEAESYLGAMRTAVNFAFCNRHVIGHWVRETFQQVFKQDWQALDLSTVYDVAHNIAKMEEHEVDGKKKTLCVHRKGATRAFWKNHPQLPQAYRPVGQPVIIPGSMSTESYLLCGLEGAKETWGSTCHGAGRTMSRHEAISRFRGSDVKKQMESQGITVQAGAMDSLAEEAGAAYKDVSQVVQTVEMAGLCKTVAKLKPLGVIKG